MSGLQDWQNEQTRDGAKHKFGNLSILTNYVKTQRGAKYTIPGIMTREKDSNNLVLREFRGKQLTNDAADCLHIIAVLEAKDKNGQVYQDVRDDVSFAEAMKIFKNSLVDVFGPDFAEVFAQRGKVPVEVELAPTGEKTNTGNDKTTFKVLRQFANDAERVAAEREYFKAFGGGNTASNGNGTIPANIESMARGLWDAVKNRDLFVQFANQQAELAPYAEALANKFATA